MAQEIWNLANCLRSKKYCAYFYPPGILTAASSTIRNNEDSIVNLLEPELSWANTDILQIPDPSNRTKTQNIWLQQSTMLFIWLVGVSIPLGWCCWGVCAYNQLCTLPKHHSHLTTNRISATNKPEWWKVTTPVSYNPGTSLLGGFNCWLCTICMYTSLIWTVKPQCSQMGLTTVAYLWLILSGKIRENSRQKKGCKVSLCAFTDIN